MTRTSSSSLGRILALVPARGGSKGIPRKNIRTMAGKPLIAWTIEAALRSSHIQSVVVSTEDEEIARVAQECGAEVPFRRPAELARDETPGIDPVLDALDRLPDVDAVLLLQPTSPLRTTEDIDRCIGMAQERNAESCVSVSRVDEHPSWMYRLDDAGHLLPLLEGPRVARRQDLAPLYAVNGALYLARAESIRRTRSFVTAETVGYVMPRERAVDIDTMLDWQLAELLLLNGK